MPKGLNQLLASLALVSPGVARSAGRVQSLGTCLTKYLGGNVRYHAGLLWTFFMAMTIFAGCEKQESHNDRMGKDHPHPPPAGARRDRLAPVDAARREATRWVQDHFYTDAPQEVDNGNMYDGEVGFAWAYARVTFARPTLGLPTGTTVLVQFSELSFTLIPRSNSRADELNGIGYRGYARFGAAQDFRIRSHTGQWSDWTHGSNTYDVKEGPAFPCLDLVYQGDSAKIEVITDRGQGTPDFFSSQGLTRASVQ